MNVLFIVKLPLQEGLPYAFPVFFFFFLVPIDRGHHY